MEEHLTKDEKKKLRQEEWKKELDQEQKRKLRSRIITWGIGAVILAFAVWFVVALFNQPSTPSTANIKIPAVSSKDLMDGPKEAPLTLVEYADFQCPTCKAYYPIIKQLQQDFKGKLLFVYRFFPLSNIHHNALNSSEAAYAASKQGKFWEMHDKLFETQDTWAESTNARDTFVTYALQLGLNVDEFKKDFNDDSTAKVVADSEQNDIDLGLNGTPTFFLNGKQLGLPGDHDAFKKLLDEQLKSK